MGVTSTHSVSGYVPVANLYEKDNGVCRKIKIAFSSAKDSICALVSKLIAIMVRLRSLIFGKKPVSLVKRDSFMDMKERLESTRNTLNAMKADEQTSLFEIGLEESDMMANRGDIVQPTEMVMNVLNGKIDELNCLLQPKLEPGEYIQDTMMDLENIAELLNMAWDARKEKKASLAIRYEMVGLAEILRICLKASEKVPSTDKESAEQKDALHFMIIDTMVSLQRLAANDPAGDDDDIPPVVCDKCDLMFKLVKMFAANKLSLRISNNDDCEIEDCVFEKAFCESYPEWNMLNTVNGRQWMFLRFVAANTGCLDLKADDNMFYVTQFKNYARDIASAKKLFYQDQNRDKAFKIVVTVLNKGK